MTKIAEYVKLALQNRGKSSKDLNVTKVNKKLPEEVNFKETVTVKLPRFMQQEAVYTALEKQADVVFDLKDFPSERLSYYIADRLYRDLGIDYRFLYQKDDKGNWEVKDSAEVQSVKAQLIEEVFEGEEQAVYNHEHFTGKKKGKKADPVKAAIAHVPNMSEEEYEQLLKALNERFPNAGKQARK